MLAEVALAKVQRGGAIGPFAAAASPHPRWNTNQRFAVEQPSSSDPHEKREVDDCKAIGKTYRTTVDEKMDMRGLEGLLDLIGL